MRGAAPLKLLWHFLPFGKVRKGFLMRSVVAHSGSSQVFRAPKITRGQYNRKDKLDATGRACGFCTQRLMRISLELFM